MQNNMSTKRLSWTVDEDQELIELMNTHANKSWTFIGKRHGTKTGKQCRERWQAHLRPGIVKTPLTKEEKIKILQMQRTMGNRWKQIAAEFPGRSDNTIKNFYYSHVHKKVKVDLIDDCNKESNDSIEMERVEHFHKIDDKYVEKLYESDKFGQLLKISTLCLYKYKNKMKLTPFQRKNCPNFAKLFKSL
ncbi:hypothetical protein H311_01645 [Anncaliia algerae PRA109]|nr:hypothetical protein H311_01645 [Anncaliia algerae PRA109]